MGKIRHWYYRKTYESILEKRRHEELMIDTMTEKEMACCAAYDLIAPCDSNRYEPMLDVDFMLGVRNRPKLTQSQWDKKKLLQEEINKNLLDRCQIRDRVESKAEFIHSNPDRAK